MPKREWRWWEAFDGEKPPVGTPDCFTDNEWAAYYEAEKQAVWNANSVPKRVKNDMCADCTLPYQISQLRIGKCNPYYGAITPIHRRAMIASGEEDPLEEKADPSWPELPELRGASVRHNKDGAGGQEEEAAPDADHDLVLSEQRLLDR